MALLKIFALNTILITSIFSTVQYSGNGASTTFNFPVGVQISKGRFTYTIDPKFNRDTEVFIGAGQAVSGNEYAIAMSFVEKSDSFAPLAISNLSINGQSQDNPLYGAKINYLAYYSNTGGFFPTAVKDGDNKVYAFFQFNPIRMLSSEALNDAAGSETSGIIGLQGIMGNRIAAVVKNNAGGTFGASGSGVALLVPNMSTSNLSLNVLNASSTTGSNQAAALNNSSDTFKIQNDVTIASDEIDIHYNSDLGVFYISVQLSSGGAGGDGARAVALGKLNNDGRLEFKKIVPDAAVSGNDQIVATGSSSTDLAITKVRTMRTSTTLHYLIVVGGNGAKSAVGNKVYALPLVDAKSSDDKGTLAKYDQDPTNIYDNGKFFNRRVYETAASDAADLLTNSDTQAIVGAGDLPFQASNSISDIFIHQDAVYVSSSNSFDANNEPGIFMSQALFDEKGRIKSWTPWKRVSGTDKEITHFTMNEFDGNFEFISGSSNSNAEKTNWSSGDANGIADVVKDEFPLKDGGVQGFFDFPNSLASFDNFSMLIATGLNKIALIASGNEQGGIFKYTRGNFNTDKATFTSGGLGSIPSNSKFVSVSGLNLGPIIAANVARNATDNKSWIFIGGVNGVAVLSDSDGNGWSGTISNLTDLSSDLSFKKIGDFKFVKKLVSDDDYLYVLTNKELVRVALNATSFKNNNLTSTVIADVEGLGLTAQGSFSDFIVGTPLGILSTSLGLFRSGNSKSIATATSTSNLGWTKITTPESDGVAFRAYPFSTTSNLNQFSTNGQLYSLNSYYGFHFANVNRWSVALTGGAVDDDTIKFVEDNAVKNVNGSFIFLNKYRNSLAILGSNRYDTVSKDVSRVNDDNELLPPQLSLLRPDIFSGSGGGAASANYLFSKNFNLDLPKATQNSQGASMINTPIILRSASGELMLAGDFGLRVNQ